MPTTTRFSRRGDGGRGPGGSVARRGAGPLVAMLVALLLGAAAPVPAELVSVSDGEASGPDLRLASVLVIDPAPGGNADGQLQPGELVQLAITLANFGNTPALSVYGVLGPGEASAGVTLLAKSASFQNVPAHGLGGTSGPPFAIQVSGALPCGATIDLVLQVQATGSSATIPVRFVLGRGVAWDLTDDGAAIRRNEEADVRIAGPDPGDGLGSGVTHGDFDGDGLEDLVVGATQGSGPGNVRPSAGEAWILYGATKGLLPAVDLAAPPPGTTVIHGRDVSDALGRGMASGDLNGDGLDDLVLGVPSADGSANAAADAGEVWILYGQPGRFPAVVDLLAPPSWARVLYGVKSGDALGGAVAVGDVDGDGFDDLLASAPGSDGPADDRSSAGSVWVVHGRSSPLPTSSLASPPAGAAVIHGAGSETVGSAVAIGDRDGDGFGDLAFSAMSAGGPSGSRPLSGTAWVLRGTATRLPPVSDLAVPMAGLTTLYGADSGDYLGSSLAFGDLDGDGRDEVALAAVIADGASNLSGNAGEVWVLPGDAAPLPATIDLFSPPANARVIFGDDAGDRLGTSLSTGDLDGDGFGDLVIGAFGSGIDNTEIEAGEGWVVFGRPSLLPAVTALDGTSLRPEARVHYGEGTGDRAGAAVSAGDLDGDGFDDLLLGASGADGAANGRPDSGEFLVVSGAATRTYWSKGETFAYVDASGGTDLGLACDDCSVSVPIGFAFPFYGERFTSLRVSSNGFVAFAPVADTASAAPRCINAKSPSSLSSLGPIVAPFWDDLDLSSSGAVYAQLSGVAPYRRLTIEWKGVPHYPGTGAATFEVSLFETTGRILFQYEDTTFGDVAFDDGAAAVAGVQNRTGAAGTAHGCGQPVLTGGLALSFSPTTPLFEDNLESIDPASGRPGKWRVDGSPFAWHPLPGGSCAPNFHGRLTGLYAGDESNCLYRDGIAEDTLTMPLVAKIPADARLSYWQRFDTHPADVQALQMQLDGGGFFDLQYQSGTLAAGGWHRPAPLLLQPWLGGGGPGGEVRLSFRSANNPPGLGWMVDDLQLSGCNAHQVAATVASVGFAQPSVYCGDGGAGGTLDAIGSACGDGSSPLAYQWYENGVSIPGATSVTWTIPVDHPAGSFVFSCAVTCAGGTAVTAPVPVTIVAPAAAVGNTLRLTESGAGVSFRWTDVSGADEYRLFTDPSPAGTFGATTGPSVTSGSPGIVAAPPTGALACFLVAGSNPTCGFGPK